MDLDVLLDIVENSAASIEELAEQFDVCSEAAVGVANLMLDSDGDLTLLSSDQLYHYLNCIRPLMENAPCEGVVGFIEEEEIYLVVDETVEEPDQDDSFRFQFCHYDVSQAREYSMQSILRRAECELIELKKIA